MNWPLLQNSLLVAGTTTVAAVGFGLVAALWLATLAARWRNVFLAIAIVALALPPFLVTNCWLDLDSVALALADFVVHRVERVAAIAGRAIRVRASDDGPGAAALAVVASRSR